MIDYFFRYVDMAPTIFGEIYNDPASNLNVQM